eukprot:COSAG02_NODE_1705_length_11236_cov_6.168178_9_plen_78_part_00
MPDEHELRIDPGAERQLWRLKHAMEAPPDGNCFIFSALAKAEPGMDKVQLSEEAESVRRVVRISRGQYAGFEDKRFS